MKSHFQHININSDQSQAIDKIEAFIKSDTNIFILQGYAGTGKTTLINGLVGFLQAEKKQFSVMAPTGRAAKILRDKTGFGKTIHSNIYKLKDLKSINADSEEVAEHSVSYYFPINFDLKEERILIVDEASMISSKESKNELFNFGTNILINDLLSHAFRTNKNNKIIFIGDPAQLPPVGDNKSNALEISFFEKLGYSVSTANLKKIMRQENNLILENATIIRNLLNNPSRNSIELNYDDRSFIKLNNYDIVDTFLNLFPNPEIGDGVIISYSNAQCFHYNASIREQLFPNKKEISVGDIILINNNNQYSYKTELFNGDLAKVVEVSQHTIVQSAPVFVKRNEQKVREIIKLTFRKISIRVPHFDEEISCYIIEDLLNSIDRDLTIDMTKMLYVNFVIRFNETQLKRELAGLLRFRVGSEEFKNELKKDPFFNALRVKYGYAITCHKSQGGEWDKIFVDYSNRTGLSDYPIKWSYTATTRGINTVYTINPPYINSFSKLKFSSIITVSHIPNNALYLSHVKVSPFHNANHHKAKSLKYWEIKEILENTYFEIINVESNGYLERYTIGNNSNQVFIIQGSHRESGHFINKFEIIGNASEGIKTELETLFNQQYSSNLLLDYKPNEPFLESLYFVMRSYCQELDISITNIVEQIDKYFVTYFLITDSETANIQFYFKKNGNFSTAMPKTFDCVKDYKLELLIEKLENYAI